LSIRQVRIFQDDSRKSAPAAKIKSNAAKANPGQKRPTLFVILFSRFAARVKITPPPTAT
jgi:hypothetical protein